MYYSQQQQPGYQQPGYQPGYQQPPPSQPYPPYEQPYQPTYKEETQPIYQPQDRFPERTAFRDGFWAILFFLHLIAVAALLGVGVKKANDSGEKFIIDINADEAIAFAKVAICCAGVAFLASVFYLYLAKQHGRILIISTFVMVILLWIAFAIFCFASGSITGGVILLLFAALNAFFFYLWRHRIPFATAVLQTVSSILQAYPASTYIAYLSLIVHIAGLSLIFGAALFVQNIASSAGVAYVLSLYCLFSLYWYSQVVKNTVHVSTSGAIGTWYFLKNQMPHNPTLKSLQRATTTSFGSVCLGSLLVALLQTLRAIFRSLRNQKNGILICIADCILGMLESLLRYFNLYAFTQVAIYGKTYCQAAKDTWNLINSHGCEAIVNDNLIGNVLTMGAFFGGLVCAIIGGILGSYLLPTFFVGCIVLGFIIGWVMLVVVMEVIQSSVSTIFVCFAMDREALRRNDPILYQKFVETYYL